MSTKENRSIGKPDDLRFVTVCWKVISVGGLLLCAGLSLWAYQRGYFRSTAAFQEFIRQFGYWQMAIFVLIQIIQVVFPILPGGISCLGGVLLFGPLGGFLCNYIGICIGSLAAFGLAKYYGRPILGRLFSEKQIHKYDRWTRENGRFLKMFAAAIFFPVAPDDFLCYLAGTTEMTWKLYVRYSTICSIRFLQIRSSAPKMRRQERIWRREFLMISGRR